MTGLLGSERAVCVQWFASLRASPRCSMPCDGISHSPFPLKAALPLHGEGEMPGMFTGEQERGRGQGSQKGQVGCGTRLRSSPVMAPLHPSPLCRPQLLPHHKECPSGTAQHLPGMPCVAAWAGVLWEAALCDLRSASCAALPGQRHSLVSQALH